ncbi:MAG TPA: response regulator transcription factor [Chthoniobacterales bacterium]|nr:response regulator transcription factor [Chthoniobacterales bacterium]
MSSNAGSLRILLADDHDVMRQGTRMLIERQPGWEVCGLASTGREAVAQADELKPNVVIMDMTMPEMNGLDAAIEIKRRVPESEILMFTAHEDEGLVQDAFEAGIKSVVFKSEAYDFLVKAIKALSEHQPFFAPKASEILFSKITDPTGARSERGPRLTGREREIVQLVAEGKSNKAIAETLGISDRTVEAHRASVLRKLNLDSVAALVRYAIRHKLIAA